MERSATPKTTSAGSCPEACKPAQAEAADLRREVEAESSFRGQREKIVNHRPHRPRGSWSQQSTSKTGRSSTVDKRSILTNRGRYRRWTGDNQQRYRPQ